MAPGGEARKKPCCISHAFVESASENPSRIAALHASGGLQRRRKETGEKGTLPPIYPGDVYFTCGEVLSAVEYWSRRIRWILDGGDDPELIRPQGCYQAKQINSAENSFTMGNQLPQVVGVYIPPSVEYIVAVLSIIRCGEAFLPLDPLWPEERILSVISASNTWLVIRCAPLHRSQQSEAVDWIVERSSCSVLYINMKAGHKRELCWPDLLWPCEGGSLRKFCYLMYTSGSTGKPKGVCGTEEGLLNRFWWMQGLTPLCGKDILLFKTSISFIDHIQEFLGAILTCTLLVIPPFDELKADPTCLVNFLEAYYISRMISVPSLMRLILPKLASSYVRDCNPLKVLILSGEKLSISLYRSLHEIFPGTKILNLYGSTEVSGDCTYFDCKNLENILQVEDLSTVPIGIAIPNCEITLVGESKNPLEGEIYVSGACLFAGYLEHLNGNPDDSNDGLQFRTGDIARRLQSGDLVFVGRHDRTVKLNGQRVSLEEIENMLKEHPKVSDAAVTYNGSHGVATHLEAYFVRKSSENFKKMHKHSLVEQNLTKNLIKSIRRWMFKKLPPVMIPSYYFCIESLPILASGKVNYLKLSSSAFKVKRHIIHFGRSQSPDSQLKIIKEVFHDALLVQDISDHDDFFMMGGDSISAAQAAHKLGIDMRLIYTFPTPVKLLNGLKENTELLENLNSPNPSPRRKSKMHADVTSFDIATGKVARSFLLPGSTQQFADPTVHDLSIKCDVQQQPINNSKVNDDSSIIHSMREDSHLPTESHGATSSNDCLWTYMPKKCSFSRCNKILHGVESDLQSRDGLWLSIKTPRSRKGSLRELWKILLNSCVDASPLIVSMDGNLHVLIGSHSHIFLCIDAISGCVLWEVKLEGRVECSAAITGDFSQVVVGCYKGKIYFIDFATGNISWYFQTDGEVKMQPIVDRIRKLIWCGSHDHSIYALDYEVHQCVYKVSCGGSIFGSPSIDVVHSMVYVASTSGRVTAVSLVVLPFSTAWIFEAGAPIFGSLSMDSKYRNVICCLVDGHVLALSSSGSVVWKASVGGPIFAGACISSVLSDQVSMDSTATVLASIYRMWHWHLILICSRDGKLYSFDMEGILLWEYETGDPITSSAYVDEHTELISESSRPTERLACVCSSSGSVHVIRIGTKDEHGVDATGVAGTRMVKEFAVMNLPGDIFSSPVMIGGRIFVGCRDDHVHCIGVLP